MPYLTILEKVQNNILILPLDLHQHEMGSFLIQV